MSRLHVAIIMDGNGRWATSRGLPRSAGHRAGAEALRRIVEAAAASPSVGTLTVYAFSTDNWRRPAAEVHMLMGLFRRYLRAERRACCDQGVRVSVVGRRDRLPALLIDDIAASESLTTDGTHLSLRIAVDYSGRDAILRAAASTKTAPIDLKSFGHALATLDGGPPTPPVDLLIRSGGEQRLSDFLLWECAYSELHFTPVMWPDFGPADLQHALRIYHRRERRFGALPPTHPTHPTHHPPSLSRPAAEAGAGAGAGAA